MMFSLITFATQWGSKYGGINSFNTDFLTAFGVNYHDSVQVICIVSSATDDEISQAKENHVTLVKLPYEPENKIFIAKQASVAIDELRKQEIQFNPEHTVWLGHDRISGEAAIAAVKQSGGRSALIHHMSYDAYEAFAEDSHSANAKTQNQKELFKQADLILAVGSLLQRALADMLDKSKEEIHLIIPGLADIEPRKNTLSIFTAFLSGRLSDDAAKIKQGHLGVAGFAQATISINQRPKLLLRGVDFESRQNYNNPPEIKLKQFAEEYANGSINLQALSFTEDRDRLYDDLKSASVALMPSWHEGFGLVAWEAIAAGVPLIVSKNSGVYEFLDEQFKTGLVEAVNVKGATQAPFFHADDLTAVADAITRISQNPDRYRQRAIELRNQLSQYTWAACVENVADYFAWQVKKNTVIPDSVTNDNPSPLEMPRKYWQQGCNYSESLLLRADEALVPFDSARQPAIDQLNTWLDDDKFPVAIRLITGVGGLGKTRLAIEICERRLQRSWHCGFLSKENAAKDMTSVWQQLLAFKQPILLVMDYAETRQTVLLALIKALIKTPSPYPVRLLLLARNGGEWWDNLPSKDAECEMLLSGYATSGPYALPELYLDKNSRHLAYTQALQAYANATGKAATNIQPDLSGEHFAKPLYVQMAALLALYGEQPATAEGLTNALLNHERRYWTNALADIHIHQPEDYAQQLLALTTLSGGFATAKQARELFGNDLTSTEFNALFNALVPLYPASRQGLQAMQPDLLGEALVAKALNNNNGEVLLNATLSHADPVIQHHALTVIARLSEHYSHLATLLTNALTQHFRHCYKSIVEVAVETRSQLSTLAQTAFTNLAEKEKSQVSSLLHPFLKNESVELARLGYAVILFLMEKSKKKLTKRPQDINLQAEHARNLNNLSISCYWVGQNKQAAKYAKQALAIRQHLAKKQPDRFEPKYAISLNNYSNRLSDLGQHDEAIKFAEDALAIWQCLATKQPDCFEPDYATSLSNYACRLGELGREKDAIVFAKQALDIRQRLEKQPNYSTSLQNYANHLNNLGKYEDAIKSAKDALDIYKRLAEKQPDCFEPDYASSLHNYASHLSDQGQHEQAIEYIKQALAIRQHLAKKQPDRFEVDYYGNCCYLVFLSWLINQAQLSSEQQQAITKLPSTMTDYQKAQCLFEFHFIQACLAESTTQRAEQFKQVFEQWQTLSKADQHSFQKYFLSCCAWLELHEPDALIGIDWLESWKNFQQQRNNRLPQWFNTLTERFQCDAIKLNK